MNLLPVLLVDRPPEADVERLTLQPDVAHRAANHHFIPQRFLVGLGAHLQGLEHVVLADLFQFQMIDHMFIVVGRRTNRRTVLSD